MHVVFVNYYGFSYLGGVELHILNLGRELMRQGAEVTLLCRAEREDGGWSPATDGFRTVRISNLKEMLAFFRREVERIDVCHAHMARKPFAFYGLFLARSFGIPTVFTPHCFYPGSDLKTHLAKELYDSSFTRLSFFLSDRVINLTPQDQRDSLACGMPIEKSRIIPNSIDFSNLKNGKQIPFRASYGIRSDFLLHVGRFAKQKCIDFLVHNHVAFKSQDLSLVLVGQDDGELKGIVRLIEANGLSDRIRVLERIPLTELHSAYREALALVMASRYEGLPTVILEAAFWGTPTIAPRVGGIPFVVEEGKSGLLYEWGDSDRYVGCVRKLCKERLRVEGTTRAELLKRFSWEANAKKIAHLYEELLNRRRLRRTRSCRTVAGSPHTVNCKQETGNGGIVLNRAGLILGESAPPGGLNVRKRLAFLMQLHAFGGKVAVDIGCGKGAYLEQIAKWYTIVVGVDIVLDNLVIAKKYALPEIRTSTALLCASADCLCLPSSYSDAVFLIEVLDHVPSVSACLKEVHRILKPGGVCYISVPNRLFPLETHPARFFGKLRSPIWFPILPWIPALHKRMATARVFSKRDLRGLASRGGFQVIGMATMYPPLEHRGGSRSRSLMRSLENTRLDRFGSTILAVLRKSEREIAHEDTSQPPREQQEATTTTTSLTS
jgi:glycosyltransferase involved in cell wall biosynthesis/SAM-dependent methyltransferase